MTFLICKTECIISNYGFGNCVKYITQYTRIQRVGVIFWPSSSISESSYEDIHALISNQSNFHSSMFIGVANSKGDILNKAQKFQFPSLLIRIPGCSKGLQDFQSVVRS